MIKQKYLSVKPHAEKSEYDNAPIASPWRRMTAFGIDVVLLFIPSIFTAAAVALLFFYIANPEGFNAASVIFSNRTGMNLKATGDIDSSNTEKDPKVMAALVTLAPLMNEMRSPGLPCAASEAVAQNNPELAAEILYEYDFTFNLSMSSRAPIPGKVIIETGKFIPTFIKTMAFFGVAALYFTFFTAGKRNQTIGKKLTRIMVVPIYSDNMSWSDSFKRFAGYMASVGMIGFGLFDLFRDPNRQLIHDKIVDTAVLVKPKRIK